MRWTTERSSAPSPATEEPRAFLAAGGAGGEGLVTRVNALLRQAAAGGAGGDPAGHEGEDPLGTWKEQQAIADRRSREVGLVFAEGMETTSSPLARFRPCTASVASDRPDQPICDDRSAGGAVLVGPQLFQVRGLSRRLDRRHAVRTGHVDDRALFCPASVRSPLHMESDATSPFSPPRCP